MLMFIFLIIIFLLFLFNEGWDFAILFPKHGQPLPHNVGLQRELRTSHEFSLPPLRIWPEIILKGSVSCVTLWSSQAKTFRENFKQWHEFGSNVAFVGDTITEHMAGEELRRSETADWLLAPDPPWRMSDVTAPRARMCVVCVSSPYVCVCAWVSVRERGVCIADRTVTVFGNGDDEKRHRLNED